MGKYLDLLEMLVKGGKRNDSYYAKCVDAIERYVDKGHTVTSQVEVNRTSLAVYDAASEKLLLRIDISKLLA